MAAALAATEATKDDMSPQERVCRGWLGRGGIGLGCRHEPGGTDGGKGPADKRFARVQLDVLGTLKGFSNFHVRGF